MGIDRISFQTLTSWTSWPVQTISRSRSAAFSLALRIKQVCCSKILNILPTPLLSTSSWGTRVVSVVEGTEISQESSPTEHPNSTNPQRNSGSETSDSSNGSPTPSPTIYLSSLNKFQKICSGIPINIFGKRRFPYSFFLQHPPQDPFRHLRVQKLTSQDFDRVQRGDPEPSQTTSLTQQQLRQKTDENLDIFLLKLSNFTTLYILHFYVCEIEDKNSHDLLLRLVDQASREQSLWNVFYEEYKGKLSFVQMSKARSFYFLFYNTPVIPNTINAYVKNLVNQLREHLVQNKESRSDAIQKMILIHTDLLRALNGAAKDFAEDKRIKDSNNQEKPDSTLNVHREEALKGLLGPSYNEDFTLSVLKTLLTKASTHIPFSFGEETLNQYIPKILEKRVLPSLASSLNSKVHQSYVPFALALTTTLIDQIDNLQTQLNKQKKEEETPTDSEEITENHSDTDKTIDIEEGLPELISNLIEAAYLSKPIPERGVAGEADDRKNIKKRIERFSKRDSILEEKIGQAIQGGLVTGTQLILDYLANPKTTEMLLAKLIERLTDPLSGKVPERPTDQNLQNQTYANQPEELEQKEEMLIKTIIDSVYEKLDGKIPVEKTEKQSQKLFEKGKEEQLSAFQAIQELSETLKKKTAKSLRDWSQEKEIHNDLLEIKRLIDLFTAQETPRRRRLDCLDQANRERHYVALEPIYRMANELISPIIPLQEAEKKHILVSQNHSLLSKIKEELLSIECSIEDGYSSEKIEKTQESLEKINGYLEGLKEDTYLTQTMISSLIDGFFQNIQRNITPLNQHQSALSAIEEIVSDAPPHKNSLKQLILRVQGRFPRNFVFNRKEYVNEIMNRIKTITSNQTEQEELKKMFNDILNWDRKSSLEDLETTLKQKLNAIKEENIRLKLECIDRIKEKISSSNEESTAHLPSFTQTIAEHTIILRKAKMDCWKSLFKQVRYFDYQITKLHQMIKKSKKGEAVPITSKEFSTGVAITASAVSLAAQVAFPQAAVPIHTVNAFAIGTCFLGSQDIKQALSIKNIALSSLASGLGYMTSCVWSIPFQAGLLGGAILTGINPVIDSIKDEALTQAKEISKRTRKLISSKRYYTAFIKLAMQRFIQPAGTPLA